MPNYVYPAIGLIGGTTGFLDAIDGTNLADKDMAVVSVQGDKTYFYVLDVDSAAAEASPGIIAPDANGGDKRWILTGFTPVSAATGFTITGGTTSKTLTVDETVAMSSKLTLALGAANLKAFMNAAGGAAEWAAGIKIGSFTRDVSLTADLAISGIGFKPSHVIFFANISSTYSASFGLDNGTNHYVMYQLDTNDWSVIDGQQSIVLFPVAGNYNLGSIKTLDSDGFTLEWAKTLSPTGTATIFYAAFR